MERKEYDLFLNMINNRDASIDNLITSGLTVNNTSLQDKNVYEQNDKVREQFKTSDGEFDKFRFDAWYNNAKVAYNYLAQTDFDTAMEKQATFHRSNMYAPAEKRRQGPEFIEFQEPNMYKQKFSFEAPGIISDRTLSIDELMQSNKVLLNPTTAGENLENAKWGDSPNDNFWGYFDDVLVQARYTDDGTHRDLTTGKMVEHHVGDPKTDQNGNFYYETLDGRDIYDKIVLNKMNVLTVDGSWANNLDFFDSDDLEQKSVLGTTMKNLALIGTMFIPYVGPWIAGLSIATQTAGLLGTLGKMLTMNSNNSTFSFMEGWAKSVSRQNASTEYAQSNPWCLENMINLVGDVFGQLKEQRFIFEKVPALFKGATQINNLNQEARYAEILDKQKKLLNTKLSVLEESKAPTVNIIKFRQALNANAASRAQTEMDSFIKGYNKLGEIISRGYMTGITVGETYGEAKRAGASDIDATLLTLGYAIGEYQLLRTGLGRWNLPETRFDTYRNKAIAKALAGKEVIETATKEGKKSYVHKMLSAGKKAFNDVWTASKANGTKTLSATLTSAAAEGVEEVSEELLADFSKGCYDVVKWLQGSNIRLNTFGYDFTKNEWNLSEIRDRYLLSLIGGAVGGGLTNLTTNYKMINNYDSMKFQDAVEQLVYMARNGGLEDFMKDVNKMTLGNKNLSTNFEIINNQAVFDPGTQTNNQDIGIKNAIQYQINIIQGILAENGAVSDNQFLDIQTLQDLRFAKLQKSTTAGAFIQEYNTLLSKITQISQQIQTLANRDVDTNKDGVNTDAEKRHNEIKPTTQQTINEYKKELKAYQKRLNDLMSGKRSTEFITKALWELTPFLSGRYNKQTLPLFAEQKFGKKAKDLTDEEWRQAKEEYIQLKPTEMRSSIGDMAMTFLEFEKQFSNVVKDHEQNYIKQQQYAVSELLPKVDALNRQFLYMSNGELLPNMQERYAPKEGLMSDQMSILASELVSIFGTDEERAKLQDIKKRRAEAVKGITPETTQEEINAIHQPFNEEQTQLVYDAIQNDIHNYAQQIIMEDFLNQEVKNQVLSLLNSVKTIVVDNENWRNNQIDEGKTGLDFSNPWTDLRQLLDSDIKSISNLNNTPIGKNLNEFAISIGREPINIEQLVDKLNTLFNATTDDITNFSTDGLDLELANAIETLELYADTIKAARTDNLNTDNLFGFNATLNQVDSSLKLAEIDKNVADMFLDDINTTLNKLRLLERVSNLNKGQKLSKQDRVATRKDLLLYKRMKFFTQMLDQFDDLDKESVQTLKSIIDTQSLHQQAIDENLKLIKDTETFQKENVAIEDAIYNFFQANSKLLTDANSLAKLINPSNFDLYTRANTLLNEGIESIDDNSFVWWLADRVALKSSDFYYQYRQVIDPDAEHPIAPIPTQELAVYHNYAGIVNGNIFDTFYQAIRISMSNDWKSKSVDDRKAVLTKIESPELFAEDRFANLCLTFLPVPRYKNIFLIEGTPGSGKSSAVLNQTILLLKKFNKSALNNVLIAHGANPDSANKLKQDLNIDTGQALSREALMKLINPNWVEYTKDAKNNYIIPDSDHELTPDNDIRSKLGINQTMKTPPSLIIIDEISRFTGYDLDQIQKFAWQYGITVLVAGDYDQSGVIGTHSLKKYGLKDNEGNWLNWKVNCERTNFPRSPKLGVSMRTDNLLKTNNLINFQLYLQEHQGELEFDYVFNDEGLYGDYTHYYSITNGVSDKDIQFDLIMKSVEKIAATLKEGEKIAYITDDENSKLFKTLSQRKDIELFKNGAAQGLEGRYFIIDLNHKTESYLNDLYTGISRAQQGSLIIMPTVDGEPFVKIKQNKKTDAPIKEPLPKNALKNFAQKRKDVLEKIEGKETPIIPRKKSAQRQVTDDANKRAELALQQAIATEKQRVIEAINNAKDINEIESIIKGAKYSQVVTDPDVLALIDQKQEEFKADLLEHQHQIQGALTNIASAGTLEELETIYTNLPPEVQKEIESTYNDKKSQIEAGIEQQKQEFVNNLIQQLNKISESGTVEDLDNLITEAQKQIPNLLQDFPSIQDLYNSAKNIIETRLKKNVPPSTPLPEEDPFKDDLAPVTEEDVSDDEHLKDSIDKRNESDQLPENQVTTNGKAKKISMILHSFNTFEAGVEEGPNGEVIQIGSPEWIAKRIDSINGLIKIDALKGYDKQSFQEYIDIIGELRSIIFNTKNKSDIDKAIKEFFGFDNIYTTFAFKSSLRKGDDFKTDKFGYSLGSPNPFEKPKGSTTLFNGSADAKSKRIHDKSLVLIIGTKETGNILELPLLALSSPFTILQSKEGRQLFADVYNTFNNEAKKQNPNWESDVKNSNETNLDLVKVTKAVIAAHENDIENKEIIDLFKLFLITDNFVTYIRDEQWTPLNNMHLNGAYVTTNKDHYQLSDGLRYVDDSNNWIPVANFAGYKNPNQKTHNQYHNPQSTTTQIFVSTNDIPLDNERNLNIHKGHPFVLVSYDKEITNDTDIIEQYINQERNPEIPKSVVLMYILPPKASVSEYCRQIFDFVQGNRSDINIGYFTTTFKLLKGLIQDDRVKNLIQRKLGNAAPKLFSVLDLLTVDAPIEKYKVILNQNQDWSKEGIGNGPKSLMYLLRGALYQLSTIHELDGGKETIIDEEAIKILDDAAVNLNINLYHHFPIPKNDKNSNEYFVLVNPEKDYKIDNKPCLIHGKVDSYNFTADMGEFVAYILDSLKPNGKGHLYHPDNTSYFNGNSNLHNQYQFKKDRERQIEINDIIKTVKEKSGIDISLDFFSNKELSDAKSEIVSIINTTPGDKIAFMINGEILISNSNPILNGKNRTISDVVFNTNGQAEVEITVDGIKHFAIIDRIKKVIEITQDSPNQIVPSFEEVLSNLKITPDTYQEYINAGKVLLTLTLECNDDLNKVFNSQTYEEFIDNIRSLDPVEIVDGEDLIAMMTEIDTHGKELSDLDKQIIQDIKDIEDSKRNELEQCRPDITTIQF